MALLDDVKKACLVSSNAFNDEFTDLINAALADMGITNIRADVLDATNPPPLVKMAIKTYCQMNWLRTKQDTNVSLIDGLKAAYDEQKSQMLMSSAYNDWGSL